MRIRRSATGLFALVELYRRDKHDDGQLALGCFPWAIVAQARAYAGLVAEFVGWSVLDQRPAWI